MFGYSELPRLRNIVATVLAAALAPLASAGVITIDFTSEAIIGGQSGEAVGSITIGPEIGANGSIDILDATLSFGNDQFDGVIGASFTFGDYVDPAYLFVIDYGPQIWALSFEPAVPDPTADPFEQLLALTLADLAEFDPTTASGGNAFSFFEPGGPIDNSRVFALTSFSVTSTAVPEPAALTLMLLAGGGALLATRRGRMRGRR